MTIENQSVNLHELTEEVVSGFYPLAEQKNLTLKLKIENLENTRHLTDATRINQILSNLISNAIKFTNKGFVKVTVSNSKSKGKTDKIKIEVEDSGIGISKEYSTLIFEEFARISGENDKQYEGTGLGLTITKRIIELLKGHIEFSSVPGKGSHFIITLPLQRHSGKNDKVLASNPSTNGHKSVFNKERILIVDDDPFLLELTTHILNEANLTVTSLTSGEEAITAINNQSFDLLITDVQMPGINGYNLLSYFRSNIGTDVPAIAVTGESNDEDHYITAGFTAVLQKPFQPNELIQAVSEMLYKKSKNSEQQPDTVRNSNNSYYSIEGIKAFAEGEEETIREILISFAQSTYENLQSFKKHVQQHNFEEIKNIAHKMLPMFRQLDANEITNQLQLLEQTSYKGKEEQWIKTCSILIIEIEQLMDIIIEENQLPFSGKVIS